MIYHLNNIFARTGLRLNHYIDRDIMFLQTAPYLVEREPPPGKVYVGNDRYKGYCADLAKKIAHEIKIDYEIRSVKDESYGSRDENGTWNGMVGELIRGVSE